MQETKSVGTVLVIGASGKTGRRVTDRLIAAGRRVRPASRSTTPRFDWQDDTTWAPVLDGVEAAYITYFPDLAIPGAAETVDAFTRLAVERGVRRLVLLSGRGEEGAQKAERYLQDSGADWTVVRCAFFNQNFDENFADSIRNGVLAMPAGDTAEPFVDADDIADVVVAALMDDSHIGQLYELTGPRLLTLAQAAEELSAAMGREVRYVPVSAEEFGAELGAHGMPEQDATHLAELLSEVLDGRSAHLCDGVQRALGRAPRDFADYAQDAAAAGAWNVEEVTSNKHSAPVSSDHIVATEAIAGREFRRGTGFHALGFDHKRFEGLMDPLVMVDHFTMREPTFGPHPHAGMSAVSVLFEDSEGQFHNRDSLGNDIELGPGDLYWLKAGGGAVHDERPRSGARTHALQIFVNLPARMKHDAPQALHVRASQMPVLEGEGYRARVALGETNGVRGVQSPALPFTILDIQLEADGRYSHAVPSGHNAWLHAMRGRVEIDTGRTVISLPEGSAIAMRTASEEASLELSSAGGAQVALLQGEPLREPIIQQGPFVMSTVEELNAVEEAYAAGRLGSIA